jgi:hypothetical protein
MQAQVRSKAHRPSTCGILSSCRSGFASSSLKALLRMLPILDWRSAQILLQIVIRYHN